MQKKQPPILIVDDNPENIAVLFEFLTKQSLEVLIAQDGESALQIAKEEQPYLILLDILMSGMNGFETCQHFKADSDLSDIPVIFITALSDTASKLKGFEMGGVDYITKPFELEEVLARVKTHLTIYHLQRELRAKEEELEKANQQLRALATIDELTQIANRRSFNERFHYEWHRLKRERLPLSLIMGDIDYFKQYNDTFGHLAGDHVLLVVDLPWPGVEVVRSPKYSHNIADELAGKPVAKTEVAAQGCLIGRDYPAPIVDHAAQRVKALALYGRARPAPNA